MQRVWPVVGCQSVLLPVNAEASLCNAVGAASHDGPEVGSAGDRLLQWRDQAAAAAATAAALGCSVRCDPQQSTLAQ
jgi:hypothetical protein